MIQHARDRRDTDAAGDQYRMRGRLIEREIIARRRNRQRCAHPQLFMHLTRTAATVAIIEYPHHIAVLLGRRVQQ